MKKSRKPLRQVIRDRLVDDIIHGRINAGEKLSESDLAAKFNVSRTPIREALLQLENDGFATHKKNIGSFVKKISTRRVQEIFDVVAQLEGHAAEMVTEQRIGDNEIACLESLHEDMERLSKEKDYRGYVEKNLLFHDFFVTKCGNETLSRIVSDLRKRMYRLVSEGSTLPTHIDQYLGSHRDIIDAVSAGNAREAGRLMKMHVGDATKFLLGLMTNLQR